MALAPLAQQLGRILQEVMALQQAHMRREESSIACSILDARPQLLHLRATLHRPTCILPTLRLPTLPSRWGVFPHSKQESLRWVVCLPRDTLLILTLLLDPPCQGLIAMEFLCMGLFQVG